MTDYSKWTPGERNAECAWRLGWVQEEASGCWFPPGGLVPYRLPGYNSSLDLCVWDLVPVLESRCDELDVNFTIRKDCVIREWVRDGSGELALSEEGIGEHTNPAEAFVLAWLKATEE